MYIERAIENSIKSINDTFPVLLVTGPRQVGKTTLLKKIADEGRKYVSLDNPTFRELAKSEPELFLQRFKPPVIIDEVQYVPELFDYIKGYVDEHKICGDFWLTGSQTFHMMKKVTESLAGRVGVIRMLGLSNREINCNEFSEFEVDPQSLMAKINSFKSMTMPEIFERIFKGSMPRLYEMPKTKRGDYFESYLETYISRDIKDLTQVADELSFFRFVGIVAARTATNVNYDTLAVETGISSPTAKQWLSILISSGLVALIEPYYNNALNRVIKSPRMYFIDTGLCSYLTRWNSPEALEAGAMSGNFFETWVVSEIYKSFLNNGKRPPLYFYRDSNKKEIDLIIHQNNTVYPIEIKKSAAPKDAIKNFSVLKLIEKDPTDEDRFSGAAHLKTRIGTGAVICLAQDVIPIDRKNWYIPAWMV